MTKIVCNVVLLVLMGTYLAISSLAQSPACLTACTKVCTSNYISCEEGCDGNQGCLNECYTQWLEQCEDLCALECGY